MGDYFMGAKARQSGASWVSIGAAYLAGIVFSIAFTPLIGLAAAPAALFLAEYLRQRRWRESLKTVGAMMTGWGWSFLVRLIIGAVMTGLWMVWAWT